MRIINLTDMSTQKVEGYFDSKDKAQVISLLSFDAIPTHRDIFARAQALAHIAIIENAEAAHIEGPAFMLYALEQALLQRAIQPLYMFKEEDRRFVEASQESYIRTFVRY